MKPDYYVMIDPVGTDKFKLTWHHGVGFPPYMVARGEIEATARDIRLQLGALVANAIERDKARMAGNAAGVNEADNDKSAIMQTLVQHCGRLYTYLFNCVDGSTASQDYVHKYIRDRIRKEPGPQSILFRAVARVYVPWGLVYDGTVAANADPDKPGDFGGFWCLKHQVSTVYSAAVSAADFVVSYDSAAFEILSGGDDVEFAKAERALAGRAAELDWIAVLLKKFGKPATTPRALLDAWTNRQTRLGLLYLFGHANARMVGFTAGETMNVGDFSTNLKKSDGDRYPHCLVFLNGCYTSNPDPDGTFFEATGQAGFCGYIGAETEVPTIFAFRFGLAFQKLLYKGIEVVDVMSRLRVQHWPLSLIYGLYAMPHVSVTPHVELGDPALPLENYSMGPLGERIGEGIVP